MKYHLARFKGRKVDICTKSTPNIMQATHNAIYEKDKNMEEAVTTKVELTPSGVARYSKGLTPNISCYDKVLHSMRYLVLALLT